MKTRLYILVLCYAVMSSVTCGTAQEMESQNDVFASQNSLQLSMGHWFFFYNANVSYERFLIQDIGERKAVFFTRIGYGRFHFSDLISSDNNQDENNGFCINNQYGFILGKNKHHIEFSVGPCYWKYSDGHRWDSDVPGFRLADGYLFLTMPSVAWRYQKKDGSWLWRAGLSITEGMFFSTGFAF